MDEEQKRLVEELLFSGQQKPSFAKLLFFGLVDSKKVFPFPSISKEEQQETEQLVKDLSLFCDQELDPDWIDRNGEIPKTVIQGLAKLGILGISVPKEYGGRAASQYTYCRIVETIARRCGSTALFINVQQSIGMQALLVAGTEKQRRQWIPKLISAEAYAAFSLTEPNAGSDANGVETRAVYDPIKKVYRINGRKQWTTNGGIADVITLMARTEIDTPSGKQDKITAFIVSPTMPGFKVLDKALEKLGMRGTKTANLAFENMEVPEENVLGKPGEGLKLALSTLNYGRITFGASCLGSAKELVERAIKHSKERYQFKRPLASFPLVKQKIARMSGMLYAMEAMTHLTAGLMDSGQSDVMLEASILKVFASDCQWQILYDTMQILGGRSFFTNEPYERMMRDARLNMIGEGSNEVLRAFIGAVGLRDVGMQLKNVLNALKSPLFNCKTLFRYSKHFFRQICFQPKLPIHSPQLKEEARTFAALIRRFGLTVPRVLAKYKEGVIERQLILDRLTVCVIGMYALTASLSKLDGEIQANKASKENILAVKLFCTETFSSMNHSLDTLFHNHDKAIEHVSDTITGVRCS